jgi:hypothetical protein
MHRYSSVLISSSFDVITRRGILILFSEPLDSKQVTTLLKDAVKGTAG